MRSSPLSVALRLILTHVASMQQQQFTKVRNMKVLIQTLFLGIVATTVAYAPTIAYT